MSSTLENLSGIIEQVDMSGDPAVLESFGSDQSFTHSLKPRLLVKPRDASQVQKLVQWANQTGTPLVPISSGGPHFKGDTVPSAPGAVMVDMSRMNKIVHIDSRNRMAIIEAGVTYEQLKPELAKAGLRISPVMAPKAHKSVVASLLEREPPMVHRYQFAVLDPLRCVEVVWGDGTLFRAGEAANQASLEASWQKGFAQINPRGPGQADFYKFVSGAQGTMGIVTWASIKCEVLPSLHKMFFVAAKKLEDLIELTYKLVHIRFGDEIFIINGATLASLVGKNTAEIKALKENLPAWMLAIGVAGRSFLPRERVDFQEKDIREITQQHGLKLLNAVPGVTGDEALAAVLNTSPEPYWKQRYAGGFQDIFFITTLNLTPGFIKTMYAAAEALNYPTTDIGVYIQPLHQGASYHCEFTLPFDPQDPAQKERAQELYLKASQDLLQQGAFYSRPYGAWAGMAFNRDAQTTIILKQLKKIFDPNNIMNPGKLCF
ncbi:MAG: FAD-binding oxidoreductase [Dehalococcoidales bacterium]|nr:FAD-binding oxidoreductase [Dehalococcoidales bacterium]